MPWLIKIMIGMMNGKAINTMTPADPPRNKTPKTTAPTNRNTNKRIIRIVIVIIVCLPQLFIVYIILENFQLQKLKNCI